MRNNISGYSRKRLRNVKREFIVTLALCRLIRFDGFFSETYRQNIAGTAKKGR